MAFRSKQLKDPNLGILYTKPKIIVPQKPIIYDTKETYFYAAKPEHLLKKYAKLITEFANSQTGRDYLGIPNFQEKISLLTPAGYHIRVGESKDEIEEYAIIYTRYPFLVKLEPALRILDLYLFNIKDFKESLRLLYWTLGLFKEPNYIPEPVKQIYFDQITAYPVAGANSPVDGVVERVRTAGVDAEIFGTIRAGVGTAATVTGTSDEIALLQASNSGGDTDKYVNLSRGIFCFDTSSLGAGATGVTGVISFFGQIRYNALGTPVFHVSGATPANTNNLVAADYGQLQTTSFGTVAYAAWSESAYNDIDMNASGDSNISLTGISKFGTQTSWDILNDATGLTWVNNAASGFTAYLADQEGITNDPKLVVSYTTTSTTSTSSSTSTTSTSSSTSTSTTSTSSSTSTSTTSTSSSTSTSTTSTSTSTTSTSISTSTTSTSSSTSSSTSTSTTTTMPFPFRIDDASDPIQAIVDHGDR